MEAPIKDTPNKGHNTKPLYQGTLFDAPIMNLPIVVIHFQPPKRGQPLYNGQNDSSQCVHYLEVQLYTSMTE